MNRSQRRAVRSQGGLLVAACFDGDNYAEVEVELVQVERLARAEGISFEQAFNELVSAACPLCHPKKEAN